MKPISFGDAYGLGLIAKSPTGVDPQQIVDNLGPEAKRIGNAVIHRDSAPRTARSAAKELLKLADKK